MTKRTYFLMSRRLMAMLPGSLKRLLFLISMGLAVASPSAVSALTLSFDPQSPTVSAGAIFNMDVRISDLDEILSAFVLEVSFDPNLMDPEKVTFYSFLGGPEDSLQDFDSTTPGILSFGQTSLLLDSDLKSLQPASFLLATLTFKALGEGGAELNFSYTELVERFDQDGIPVSFPPEEIAKIPANVVIQPATNIPEPGTLMLMASGLAFCFARRINRKTVNSK